MIFEADFSALIAKATNTDASLIVGDARLSGDLVPSPPRLARLLDRRFSTLRVVNPGRLRPAEGQDSDLERAGTGRTMSGAALGFDSVGLLELWAMMADLGVELPESDWLANGTDSGARSHDDRTRPLSRLCCADRARGFGGHSVPRPVITHDRRPVRPKNASRNNPEE
jgi:hypothetical protein